MGPRAGLDVVEKRRSLVPPGIRNPDSPTRIIVCEPTTMSRLPPCCKGYANHKLVLRRFVTKVDLLWKWDVVHCPLYNVHS